MQGRVRVEDALQDLGRQLAVDAHAGCRVVLQPHLTLERDQRSDPALREPLDGADRFQDRAVEELGVEAREGTPEVAQPAHLVEGAAQLGLEQHDDRQNRDGSRVLEEPAQQDQVQLVGGQADDAQHDQADDELRGLRPLHEAQQLVEDEGDRQDVDDLDRADPPEDRDQLVEGGADELHQPISPAPGSPRNRGTPPSTLLAPPGVPGGADFVGWGRVEGGEQRHLRPQPVLGLLEHDRARPVDHAGRDLLAAVGGQAVHEDGVRRQVHQRLVDAVLREARPPGICLRLLAHGGPHVRVDDGGALDRAEVGRDPDGRRAGDVHDRLIGRRRHHGQREAEQRRRFDEGTRDIVAVSDERDVGGRVHVAERFPDGQQVREHLARVRAVGQRVDDGVDGRAGQVDEVLVREQPGNDAVAVAVDHSGHVSDRLPAAEPDILVGERGGAAAQALDADLE